MLASTSHVQYTTITSRYAQLAASPDPHIQRMARSQLARVERARRPAPETLEPSRWAHVPLADLFVAAGNRLVQRANGRIETGHEPEHSSRSARCVLIDPAAGRWSCRGCGQGGDAVTVVQRFNGWSYRRAIVWLREQYGSPADQRPASLQRGRS